MNIQTFIFNWRGQYEKTVEKEKQLKAIGKSPIVINSDDAYNDIEGWHHIGDDCYFGEQFAKAIELFDSDILFHVQADASYDNWEKLYADAEKYFEETDWGIYAPNVDYTWYDSSRTDITSVDFPIEGLKIVANTDCTCWFIHKDIIDLYKKRNLKLEQYKMGWSWDIVLPAICYINQRPVIRDYNHTVNHPQGTSYNTQQAEKEMWDLFQSLPNDLKEAFSYIKGDRQQLAKYYAEDYSI
jgi:hypothetical protein